MPKRLIVCTLCQRVERRREWVEMAQAIRELRTFELDRAPKIHGVICDDCVDSILNRRAQPREDIAA